MAFNPPSAVQNRANLSSVPFIRSDNSLVKEAEVVAQIDPRTGDLARYTLMSQDPLNQKWHPFTDETATDGTQISKGIILAEITEEQLLNGDTESVPILVGNAIVDREQIVIENGKTLDTIINVPVGLNQRVEDVLAMFGLFVESTVDIDEFENQAP